MTATDFNYIQMMKNLYTDSFFALFVFGALFIIFGRRKLLEMPSSATINEATHNLLLILFNTVIGIFLFGNLATLSNFLYSDLSLPHLTHGFWTTTPKFLIFILAVIAMDFQNYWAHRILHTKYLWPIHVLHHSDAHITWTTSYRIHILEWVIMSFVYVTLIGWLFIPPEIAATAGVVKSWYSKFVHCQLGWNFGAFRKVIVSPNYHKWHHSISPEAYDKNLSDMFPLWDIIFKTHYDIPLSLGTLSNDEARTIF